MSYAAAAAAGGGVAGEVLVQDRFLTGRVGDYHYEHCLEVRLTREALLVRPTHWAAYHPPLHLPLDAIVCVYAHASRYAPRLEFVYQHRGGPQVCWFSPGKPRRWLERARELGLLIRPHGLDAEALPERNLGHLVRNAFAALLAASSLAALAAAALRVVGG